MEDLFNFSISGLIAGLLFSGVGLWLWKQAKIRASFQLYMIAIALMIYPYLTPNAFWTWAAGFGLCGFARYFWYD